MKLRFAVAAAAVAFTSPLAIAGNLTGNGSVVSDYMFRGLDQTGGNAAVQGGVDYAFDFGLYSGLWISNSLAGGGNEVDVYTGYGRSLGPAMLDAGVIFYGYSEDTEFNQQNGDYGEVYLGGSIGPVSAKVFYTPEFGRDTVAGSLLGSGDTGKNELLYGTLTVTIAVDDSVFIVPQVGFSSGDGAQDAFGDDYLDYSITGIKKLPGDLSFSLAVIGTDLDNANGTPDNQDNPKFVIGVKKLFDV